MKKKSRPVVSFVSEKEAENHFQKARIELLNNIPMKGDSKKTIQIKKKRHNDLTTALARFNHLQ